jgi:hypothetical protein
MRLAILLFFLPAAPAAVLTVKTTGGTFSPVTRANIQAAFTAAACGDEIQIEAGTETLIDNTLELHKDCAEGNEVVVTTTMKSWLPDSDTRITPSYRPLIPMLRLQTNTNRGYIPILNVGSTAGNPHLSATNRGIKIVGIGFMAPAFLAGHTTRSWGFIRAGDYAVCNPDLAANANLTFDRLYMTSDFSATGQNGGAFKMAGNNIKIINSFLDDFHQWGEYQPGIMANNGGNNYLIRNNYLGTGMTEHVHFGNDGPFCQAGLVVPTGIVIEHNHAYKSLRWYAGTPYASGELSAMKNYFECKSCQDVDIRWNTGENSWANVQGQHNAITLTTRIRVNQAGTSGNEHDSSAKATNPTRANVDGTRTVVTLSCGTPGPTCNYENATGGKFDPVWTIGGCISLATVADPDGYQWEARQITAVNSATEVVVSPAFSASGLSDRRWSMSQCFNKVQDVRIFGNFWKNTVTELSFHPRDTSLGRGGTGGNVQYHNNISVASSPYYSNCCVLGYSSKVTWQGTASDYPISGFSFRNNTGAYGTAVAGTSGGQSDITRDTDGNFQFGTAITVVHETGGLYQNIAVENNLWGTTRWNVFGAAQFNESTADAATSRLRYNTAIGMTQSGYEPCAGNRVCGSPASFYSGTAFRPGFRNVAGNDFAIRPTSVYARAGTDGRDIGADPRQVASIRDLSVKPASDYIVFSWSLPEPLRQMPCSLEVSPDSSLIHDSGTYTVVNALRPDYFRRADSDRSNPRALQTAAGTRRWFQVGENTVVTGDDGAEHPLALTPKTAYHYRLMCGGATERGTVRTLPPAEAALSPVQIDARASVGALMRARYGSIVGGVAIGSAVPCASGCRISIPAAPGKPLLYYLDELDAHGAVVRTGVNPAVIPIG